MTLDRFRLLGSHRAISWHVNGSSSPIYDSFGSPHIDSVGHLAG